MNVTMFWISFCGPQKEANAYEYTVKIVSSTDWKAGRTKFLASGTRKCILCDISHEEVKKRAVAVLFPKDLLEEAYKGEDENKLLWWSLSIKKK